MAGQAGVVLDPGCEQWQLCEAGILGRFFFLGKLWHSSTSICAEAGSVSAQTLLYILNCS